MQMYEILRQLQNQKTGKSTILKTHSGINAKNYTAQPMITYLFIN